MVILRASLVLWLAVLTSGCPAVPPVVPLEDAIYEALVPRLPDDTTVTPDVETPQATEFGPCDTALDCRTYPNAASVCEFQTCALQCVPGFANCDREVGNGCEQSLSTPAHCAGCDVLCEPDNGFGSCATGVCLVAACNLGFGDCDAQADNGCETLLVTVTDCGGCGVPCTLPNALATCDAGDCAVDTCDAGFGDCDGQLDNGCETAVDTRLMCGDCDTVCTPGQGCAFDHCAPVFGDGAPLPSGSVAVAGDSAGAHYAWLTVSENVTWQSESDPITVQGASDALLLKLDAEGAPAWSRRFGGLNVETAAAMAVDSEDQVVVAGTFQSGMKLAGELVPHTGGDDIFVAAYDTSGALRWGLGLGGVGDDRVTSIAVTRSGEVALVGTAVAPASFGGEVLTSEADPALGVVALYGSSGAALWSRAVTSASPVTLVDVGMSEAGDVHVLANGHDTALYVDEAEVGAGPMVLTWLADGTFSGAQAVALEEAHALAVDPLDILWVGGVDDTGQGQLLQVGGEAPQSIAVPAVSGLTAGDASVLYVTGVTAGAFDVGQGPVVVDGVYAARYDGQTGGADWFVALDGLGLSPHLAKTTQGIIVGGARLIPLGD
ncbi:MAG: hypothetical protein ACPGU1_11325 [Myxococcota bacterium]